MPRFVRNKKAKGTEAERVLIHEFWDKGWAAMRAAGSGSSKYPSPDIIASNGVRRVVMEVKCVNGVKKYFTNQEILDLQYFANKFNAEPWVGIRFKGDQWFFIPTTELRTTKSLNYVIDLITMKKKGFKFDVFVK